MSTAGDLFENITLIARVSAALTKASVDAAEVRLFEDEASQFTSYMNVLRTVRHWVTVTS